MRAAFKPDLGTSAAQLVFGEALRLPGEFFRNPEAARKQSASELTRTIRQLVSDITPTPTAWHRRPDDNRPFVSAALASAAQVFVRIDGYKAPLQAPYKGPYPVLERGPKAYIVDLDGKTESVAVDRLKPAYREEPEPQLICDPAAQFSPEAEREEPAATAERQSRAGRVLRPPQRLIDASM